MNRNGARICMFTTRSFERNAFRCGLYESQDVLSEVDDVDLIDLQPKNHREILEHLYRRLIWKDISKRIVSMNVSCRPIRPAGEYDVFITLCAYYQDLIHLPAIRDWKSRCKTSICWIQELWSKSVRKNNPWLSGLRHFDHVAVGLEGTVPALSEALGRPCHYVPVGVDALRFSPYPGFPPRVIDIYSIGRIWEGVHRNILRLASGSSLFYVHDTFHSSNAQVNDYREHREMFASMARRSKIMLVAPARMNDPEEAGGQAEAGMRFFEASAAGAVMLGQSPQCDSYGAMFGWPDAVVEIQKDGSDLGSIVTSLMAQPERMRKISRRNVIESLLRHDWVYRWRDIFDIAGLEPSARMLDRELRLKQLARRLGDTERDLPGAGSGPDISEDRRYSPGVPDDSMRKRPPQTSALNSPK